MERITEISRNIRDSKTLTEHQKSSLMGLLLSMEEVYNEIKTENSIVRVSEVSSVFVDIMSVFGFIE